MRQPTMRLVGVKEKDKEGKVKLLPKVVAKYFLGQLDYFICLLIICLLMLISKFRGTLIVVPPDLMAGKP